MQFRAWRLFGVYADIIAEFFPFLTLIFVPISNPFCCKDSYYFSLWSLPFWKLRSSTAKPLAECEQRLLWMPRRLRTLGTRCIALKTCTVLAFSTFALSLGATEGFSKLASKVFFWCVNHASPICSSLSSYLFRRDCCQTGEEDWKPRGQAISQTAIYKRQLDNVTTALCLLHCA